MRKIFNVIFLHPVARSIIQSFSSVFWDAFMAVSIRDDIWDLVPCSNISNRRSREYIVSGRFKIVLHSIKSQMTSLIDTATKVSLYGEAEYQCFHGNTTVETYQPMDP
jgi:hypothetical protein